MQYPSFGPTTCIIKRWLRSQLLDNYHFWDVTISLLNAHLYLKDYPQKPPCSPQVAFLRFLKFFAETDFHFNLILVNFNDEIKGEL